MKKLWVLVLVLVSFVGFADMIEVERDVLEGFRDQIREDQDEIDKLREEKDILINRIEELDAYIEERDGYVEEIDTRADVLEEMVEIQRGLHGFQAMFEAQYPWGFGAGLMYRFKRVAGLYLQGGYGGDSVFLSLGAVFSIGGR